MIKISAVIITYNEEINIGRCLDSLIDTMDEVIVIDSFSTDKTEEICSKYPVKFIKKEWLGYSITKNFGNNLASNDYIFSIDADEALSDELNASILAVKNAETLLDAYKLTRLTNYCGTWIHHCGWYPDTKLRLWDKSKGQWEGDIHEDVKLQENSKTAMLNGDLFHYSFHTITQHVKQADKFTDLTAQDAFNKGTRSNLMKILFKPCVKFIRDYIIKLGFLDGYHGYCVCKISAFATFMKYSKLMELQRKEKS